MTETAANVRICGVCMAPETPAAVHLYDVRLDRPGKGGHDVLASAVTEQEAIEVVGDYGPDDTIVSIHSWASEMQAEGAPTSGKRAAYLDGAPTNLEIREAGMQSEGLAAADLPD